MVKKKNVKKIRELDEEILDWILCIDLCSISFFHNH